MASKRNNPDHGTIAGFVQKNKTAFRKVHRDLTLILKVWGLIDGKRDLSYRNGTANQNGYIPKREAGVLSEIKREV